MLYIICSEFHSLGIVWCVNFPVKLIAFPFKCYRQFGDTLDSAFKDFSINKVLLQSTCPNRLGYTAEKLDKPSVGPSFFFISPHWSRSHCFSNWVFWNSFSAQSSLLGKREVPYAFLVIRTQPQFERSALFPPFCLCGKLILRSHQPVLVTSHWRKWVYKIFLFFFFFLPIPEN